MLREARRPTARQSVPPRRSPGLSTGATAPGCTAHWARPGPRWRGAVLLVGSLALVPADRLQPVPQGGHPAVPGAHRRRRRARRWPRPTGRRARRDVRSPSVPEVRAVMMNVGRSNPDMYYNIVPRHERPTVAEAFVLLEAVRSQSARRRCSTRCSASLRRRMPGRASRSPRSRTARRSTRRSRSGWWGRDLDTLRQLAARLDRRSQRTAGTRNVGNGSSSPPPGSA